MTDVIVLIYSYNRGTVGPNERRPRGVQENRARSQGLPLRSSWGISQIPALRIATISPSWMLSPKIYAFSAAILGGGVTTLVGSSCVGLVDDTVDASPTSPGWSALVVTTFDWVKCDKCVKFIPIIVMTRWSILNLYSPQYLASSSTSILGCSQLGRDWGSGWSGVGQCWWLTWSDHVTCLRIELPKKEIFDGLHKHVMWLFEKRNMVDLMAYVRGSITFHKINFPF
jgi:hypothetical protein